MAIKSVFFQRDALRWLIWSCVILVLVGFFLSTVNRNQEKITRTKAVVIGKVMQQRINELHQAWLIEKQPNYLQVDNTVVKFDQTGWITLSNNENRNCKYLLSILYNDADSIKHNLFIKSERIDKKNYSCVYGINTDIEIKAIKINSLHMEVIFLT
ncbi:hypothetical protein JKJ11_02600 [Vibrio sp. SCSIO 43133]|uniref:hypothetical protein n=1 Tax=Vibrio sp. SCSIO 43133 TaxID=2802577 RepID=UPI0020758C0A|nr:hypothetical protein [Vibrio sp. SCSIO 43133]USE00986.1 hypothetical protein JKJ11_02600 [Vibrio sp. SCSIO 43133]